jgi:hypothetical protein
MDFKRLGQGDLVAAAGGLVLFLSLLVNWFGVKGNENLCGSGKVDCNGFQTFTILDILFVLAALAPLILVWIVVRGHELSWPPGEVTMIVGAVATTLILYNGVVDRVGENRSFVSLELGWFLGLLGALLIIVGGAISQITRGGVRRRPPGTFT